jgi:hypothetical protein
MKNIYKILTIFTLLVCYHTNNAQEILLFENTPKNFEEIDNDFGPNRKKFNFSSIGIGAPLPFTIGPEETLPTQFGIYFMFNKNYKLKINNLLAIHSNLGYSSSRYYLNENDRFKMPIQSLDAEKISYLIRNLNSNIGLQINMKRKRGNQFGKYINLGIYGSWIFHHKLKYEYPNSNLKINKTNLNYLEEFNFGLSAKLGIKKNAIFIKYRLSNMFKPNETNLSELPKIIAGLELDIFSKNYR